MQISTITWTKNSNDLLDYENEEVRKYIIKVRNEGCLKRENDKIIFIKEEFDINSILTVKINYDNFFIKFPLEDQNFNNEIPFFVIKYIKSPSDKRRNSVISRFKLGI